MLILYMQHTLLQNQRKVISWSTNMIKLVRLVCIMVLGLIWDQQTILD